MPPRATNDPKMLKISRPPNPIPTNTVAIVVVQIIIATALVGLSVRDSIAISIANVKHTYSLWEASFDSWLKVVVIIKT